MCGRLAVGRLLDGCGWLTRWLGVDGGLAGWVRVGGWLAVGGWLDENGWLVSWLAGAQLCWLSG